MVWTLLADIAVIASATSTLVIGRATGVVGIVLDFVLTATRQQAPRSTPARRQVPHLTPVPRQLMFHLLTASISAELTTASFVP
jgi:hypothetical protein